MTCTEEYREHIEYTLHAFTKSLSEMQRSTQRGHGAGSTKEKCPLNTLQKKVLQYYKNKSLYHLGKKRHIIAKTTTIRSYGG